MSTPQADAENHPTCSFQNKPLPQRKTRKRGASAFLQDCSNQLPQEPLQKRVSAGKAATLIAADTVKDFAPRGDSVKGGTTRWTPGEYPTPSLCNIIRDHPELYRHGMERINGYLARNTSSDIQRAYALKVFHSVQTKWEKGIVESAEIAAELIGVSAQSIRVWAKFFFVSLATWSEPIDNFDDEQVEQVLSSERGQGAENFNSLVQEESFQLEARQFVRQNANKKGEPNLTAEMFQQWVCDKYRTKICKETARVWLHKLGFDQRCHSKGVYFDGHDREDVVAHRKQFVSQLADLESKTMSPSQPHPVTTERPIIRVYHDESTFNANAMQSSFWADEEVQVLRQKSLGAAIMVSDFIEDIGGYLRHEGEEARVCIEPSRDGYFNSDGFLTQVEKAVSIFEKKYPDAQGLFLFDNAPSHCKYAPDALNATHMNVNPGGKQPKLCDTTWNGQIQHLCLPDGTPKGMKMVLEERGINTRRITAPGMRKLLSDMKDFKEQKSLVEELILSKGHLFSFLPKFHCELNPIERCWCRAKQYTRQHANGSIIRLRRIVREGLESVTLDLIQKYYATCRDYERAYREGHVTKEIEAVVKVFKSHRRISDN